MNKMLIILITSIFGSTFSLSQEHDYQALFSSSSHIELAEIADSLDFNLFEFSFSDFMIETNGIKYTEPRYLQLWESDETIEELDQLGLNETIQVSSDSTINYYKVYQIDSVLCLKAASLKFPIDSNLDSIFTSVLNKLDSGIHWNDLYYQSDCNLYRDSLIGSYGWQPISLFVPEFLNAWNKNSESTYFSVEIAEYGVSFIVCKEKPITKKALKKVMVLSIPL